MKHLHQVGVIGSAFIGATFAASVSTADTPFPSTNKAPSHAPTLITNATVRTGTGERLDEASLYFVEGKIVSVGETPEELNSDTRFIDAEGSWVTPGIIDVHSHLGVYPSPDVDAHSDGNEATAPVTAEVWAEHSVWPQDPGFGGPCGRYYGNANTARIGKPIRWPRRYTQKRGISHLSRNEVP